MPKVENQTQAQLETMTRAELMGAIRMRFDVKPKTDTRKVDLIATYLEEQALIPVRLRQEGFAAIAGDLDPSPLVVRSDRKPLARADDIRATMEGATNALYRRCSRMETRLLEARAATRIAIALLSLEGDFDCGQGVVITPADCKRGALVALQRLRWPVEVPE